MPVDDRLGQIASPVEGPSLELSNDRPPCQIVHFRVGRGGRQGHRVDHLRFAALNGGRGIGKRDDLPRDQDRDAGTDALKIQLRRDGRRQFSGVQGR